MHAAAHGNFWHHEESGQLLACGVPKPEFSAVTSFNSPKLFSDVGFAGHYLDTVPESKRMFWGLLSRTNAPDGVP